MKTHVHSAVVKSQAKRRSTLRHDQSQKKSIKRRPQAPRPFRSHHLMKSVLPLLTWPAQYLNPSSMKKKWTGLETDHSLHLLHLHPSAILQIHQRLLCHLFPLYFKCLGGLMQEMLSMEAIINPIMDGVNLQNMLFFWEYVWKSGVFLLNQSPKRQCQYDTKQHSFSYEIFSLCILFLHLERFSMILAVRRGYDKSYRAHILNKIRSFLIQSNITV